MKTLDTVVDREVELELTNMDDDTLVRMYGDLLQLIVGALSVC